MAECSFEFWIPTTGSNYRGVKNTPTPNILHRCRSKSICSRQATSIMSEERQHPASVTCPHPKMVHRHREIVGRATRARGTALDPETVNTWFAEHGLIRHVVGQAYLCRDASCRLHDERPVFTSIPPVCSTVHENEPAELLCYLPSRSYSRLTMINDQPASSSFPSSTLTRTSSIVQYAAAVVQNLHIAGLCTTQSSITESGVGGSSKLQLYISD